MELTEADGLALLLFISRFMCFFFLNKSFPFDLKTCHLDTNQLLLNHSGTWQQVEGEEASGGAFPLRPRKRLSLLAAPE